MSAEPPSGSRSDKGVDEPFLVFEHLDVFSLVAILRRSRSSRRIGYMTESRSPLFRHVRNALARSGFRFERVQSPYEWWPRVGVYSDLQTRIKNLSITKIEPAVHERLNRLGRMARPERDRTARCITLTCFKPLKRALELVIAVERLNAAGVPAVGALKQSWTGHLVAKHARNSETRLELYRAWRFRMPPRPGFLDRERDLSHPEQVLRNTLRFILSGLRTVGGLVSVFWPPDHPFEKSGIDVIALNSKPRRMPYIDDLFWIDALNRQKKARIAVLFTNPPDPDAARHYGERTVLVCDLNRVLRGREGFGPAWRRVRWRHLTGMFKAAFSVVIGVVSGRLPIWMAGCMLPLLERASLYEALMRESGARIGWAMTEGHELNTQALALAAARTGGVTLGTTWSMKYVPSLASSNNRNDVTFIWGNRHRSLLTESCALTRRLVVAGYPAGGVADSHELATGRNRHSICLYDNAVGIDLLMPRAGMSEVYRAVLDIIQQDAGVTLLLKAKREDFRKLDQDIVARIEKAIASGQATLETDHGNLAAGMSAGLVIGAGPSSLAALAAQRGKQCIIHDPERVLERWPSGIPWLVLTENPSQLRTAIASALGAETTHRPQCSAIDAFGDADGDTRVAHYIAGIVSAFERNMSGSEALEYADEAYRSRFGDGYIFTPRDGDIWVAA